MHKRMVEYANYEKYIHTCISFMQSIDQRRCLTASQEDTDYSTSITGSSSDDTDMAPCPSSPPTGEASKPNKSTDSAQDSNTEQHQQPQQKNEGVVKPTLRHVFPQPQQYNLHPSCALTLPPPLQQPLKQYFPTDTETVPASPLHDSPKEGVDMEDFLRFWTPDLASGDKVDRWLALISPPEIAPQFQDLHDAWDEACAALVKDIQQHSNEPESTEGSLPYLDAMLSRGPRNKKGGKNQPQVSAATNACGVNCYSRYPLHFPTPRVRMCDIRPLVEALVDRHPDLAIVRREPILREEYIVSVLTSVFSSLHGHCTGVITRAEIRESNLVEAFHTCATRR